MTIRVCHNKFNINVDKVLNGLSVFLKFFIVFILIGGIYLWFIADWNMPLDTDTEIFRNNSGVQALSILGISIGSFGILMIGFLSPWMELKPTWFGRLNTKLKMFEWREDC